MKPLVTTFDETLDRWLANPGPLGYAEWVMGEEGEVYIRYHPQWDQLDLANFEILQEYQRRGVAYSLLLTAIKKPIRTVKVERIVNKAWAAKVITYTFPQRRAEIREHGSAVTVSFVKDSG